MKKNYEIAQDAEGKWTRYESEGGHTDIPRTRNSWDNSPAMLTEVARLISEGAHIVIKVKELAV